MAKKFLTAALFALLVAAPASAQTSSTQRTLNDVMGLLGDNTTGAISPQDLRDAIASIGTTGWASYIDTQYVLGVSDLSIPADTLTDVPNNAGVVLSDYAPNGASSFYDGTTITGRLGDAVVARFDMVVTPTSASTTLVELRLDIGGSQGVIYTNFFSFPKGNGVSRFISTTVLLYNLDTFVANGGTLKIIGDGPFDLANVAYTFSRTHRGGLSQ